MNGNIDIHQLMVSSASTLQYYLSNGDCSAGQLLAMRTSTQTHSNLILDDLWDHTKKSSNVERTSESMFSDLVEGTLNK